MRLSTLAVASVFLAGCAARKPPPPWVTRPSLEIQVPEGTRIQDRPTGAAIQDQLPQRGTSWILTLPGAQILGQRATLDLEAVTAGAQGLERWLVDQGWEDATVETEVIDARTWWIGRDDERWKTPLVRIDLGTRSRVAERSIDGLAELAPASRRAVLRTFPRRGAPTSPALRAEAARQAALVLAWHGFAAPTVEMTAVDEGGASEVALEVSVRPGARISANTVQLNGPDDWADIAAGRVIDRRLAPGEEWPSMRLARLSRRLQARADVAGLEVERTLVGEEEESELVLQVEAAPPRRPAVGVNPAEGGSVVSPRAVVDWSTGSFRRFPVIASGSHTAGWRLFEGPGGEMVRGASTGPTSLHQVEAEVFYGPLSRASLRVGASAGIDARRGTTGAHGLVEFGPSYRPARDLRLHGGIRAAAWQYFPFPTQREGHAIAFGPEAGARGMASAWTERALYARLEYDSRDNGTYGTRGMLLTAEAIPWGRALDRPWSRYEGRFLALIPTPSERVVLAPRAAAGAHLIDDSDGTGLLSHRMLLGGTEWMRGFGFGRLGPPGAQADLNQVLVGGDAMLYAGVESRFRVERDLWLMVFGDVGRTWDAVTDQYATTGEILQQGVRLTDLQPVAGIGATARTPIGGLVSYAGVRLAPDAHLLGSVPRVAFHVTVAPAF